MKASRFALPLDAFTAVKFQPPPVALGGIPARAGASLRALAALPLVHRCPSWCPP